MTTQRKSEGVSSIQMPHWIWWCSRDERRSLAKLFDDPTVSPKILFKGGTSLSKVFGLIERFLEDIDLILDWRENSRRCSNCERSTPLGSNTSR